MLSARQREKLRAYDDVDYEPEAVVLGLDDARPGPSRCSASSSSSASPSPATSRPASPTPSLELFHGSSPPVPPPLAESTLSPSEVVFLEHRPSSLSMDRTASAASSIAAQRTATPTPPPAVTQPSALEPASPSMTPALPAIPVRPSAVAPSPSRRLPALPMGLPARPSAEVIAASLPSRPAAKGSSPTKVVARVRPAEPPRTLSTPGPQQAASYERPMTPLPSPAPSGLPFKRKLSYERPAASLPASYDRPRPASLPAADAPAAAARSMTPVVADAAAAAKRLSYNRPTPVGSAPVIVPEVVDPPQPVAPLPPLPASLPPRPPVKVPRLELHHERPAPTAPSPRSLMPRSGAQMAMRRLLISTPNKKVGPTRRDLPMSPRFFLPRANGGEAARDGGPTAATSATAGSATVTGNPTGPRFITATEVKKAKAKLLATPKRKTRRSTGRTRSSANRQQLRQLQPSASGQPHAQNPPQASAHLPEEYRIKGGVGSLVGNEAGRDIYLRALYQLQRQMFDKGGAVVSLDFEGYQSHHDKSVVQTGLVTLEWSRTESRKLVETKEYRHYCSEYSSLKSILPLNSYNKTEQLPLSDIVTRVRSRLQALVDCKVKCLILLHDQKRDAECLREVFGVPAEWLELFGTKTPIKQVIDVDGGEADGGEADDGVEVDEGPPFRVIDTQQLYAIVRRINYKVGLRRCCFSVQADRYDKMINFHNATNDADFTIKLYIKLYATIRKEVHEAERAARELALDLEASTSIGVMGPPVPLKPVRLPPVIVDVDALVAGGESGESDEEDEGSDEEISSKLLAQRASAERQFARSLSVVSSVSVVDVDAMAAAAGPSKLAPPPSSGPQDRHTGRASPFAATASDPICLD